MWKKTLNKQAMKLDIINVIILFFIFLINLSNCYELLKLSNKKIFHKWTLESTEGVYYVTNQKL